jgi:hypothetical protein
MAGQYPIHGYARAMVHYQQIRDAWGGVRIRRAKSPGIPGFRCADRHIGVRRAGTGPPRRFARVVATATETGLKPRTTFSGAHRRWSRLPRLVAVCAARFGPEGLTCKLLILPPLWPKPSDSLSPSAYS